MVIDLERGLLLHLVVILLIPLFRVAIPPLVRILLFEKKYSIWLYPTTQLKSPIKDVPRIHESPTWLRESVQASRSRPPYQELSLSSSDLNYTLPLRQKLAIIDDDARSQESRDGKGVSCLWPFPNISSSSFHQALFATSQCRIFCHSLLAVLSHTPLSASLFFCYSLQVSQLFYNLSNGISRLLLNISRMYQPGCQPSLQRLLSLFFSNVLKIVICGLKCQGFLLFSMHPLLCRTGRCASSQQTHHRHPARHALGGRRRPAFIVLNIGDDARKGLSCRVSKLRGFRCRQSRRGGCA